VSDSLIDDILPSLPAGVIPEAVRLQEGVRGAGFTDIELLASGGAVHIVLEAKRGYQLPQ
jgi:hypothetical protein